MDAMVRTVLAEFCRKNDVAYYPGVFTPSEVQTALDLGLDQLIFFQPKCLAEHG